MSPRKRKIDEDGEGLDGVQLEYKGNSVTAISSKETRDCDRWKGTSPDLSKFPNLAVLDLYKNRYIASLHPSVATLTHLKILRLSHCSRLRELPSDIGGLTNLEEVRRLTFPGKV